MTKERRMNLFDKKFVYFMWDDKLEGKSVLCADNIMDLIIVVNSADQNSVRTVSKSLNPAWPFCSEEEKSCSWRFAYYDPLYNYKVAYNKGAIVSYRSKGSSDFWVRVTHPMWDDEKYEYMIGLVPVIATNREVVEWLAKGNGMLKCHDDSVTTTFYFYATDMDKPCHYNVRKWEDKEWHPATREYLGI